MKQKVLMIVTLLFFVATATDISYGKIRKVWIDKNSDYPNSFWFQLEPNSPSDGTGLQERYVALSDVGELYYKQLYSMALIAMSEQHTVKTYKYFDSRKTYKIEIYRKSEH